MAHTPIENVTDTAYWVAYYRARESERSDALFRDPFAKDLVGDHGKNISDSMAAISRYTEWSVISRTVIIDRFIEKLVQEGVDAVVNLGAGLDSRPYRMNLPPTLEWVEADYPKIIAHKTSVLKGAQPKCKLTRVEVDLADATARQAFLAGVVPGAKKVLILTEGVVVYLSPEQVTALSHDLIAQKRFAFWITEYFHRKVYRYLKATVRTLKMKRAPLLFYPDDWYGFFNNLGWRQKETGYTAQIAREFKRKPPMPKWAALIFRFLPARVQEESMRMAGYVVFQRDR
jgi:methyltransferase (TIGR00027 family)